MEIARCRFRCRTVTAYPGGRQRACFRRETGEIAPAMLVGTEPLPPSGQGPEVVGGDVEFLFTGKQLDGAFVPGAVYTLQLFRGDLEGCA